ncbi:glycosyltransferase, partial [Vibrio cholerae]|nr:glycosyltransferase [Vibrio cholerae]EJL6485519.1 glycosyltransferase [Vibrio cholerae]
MDSVRWLNYLGTKDMTEQPKVAVLIGCYNHEDFIIPCLESVLSQTYSKVDIYIADDCSSDKTRDVIRNYIQKKDLRLHIIFNKENKGISEN